MRDRSGDVSIRFTGEFVTYPLSLAFSVRARCADWIAVEVFGREVAAGEDGFIGSGGGARSGSELSHLKGMKSAFFVNLSDKNVLHWNYSPSAIR